MMQKASLPKLQASTITFISWCVAGKRYLQNMCIGWFAYQFALNCKGPKAHLAVQVLSMSSRRAKRCKHLVWIHMEQIRKPVGSCTK